MKSPNIHTKYLYIACLSIFLCSYSNYIPYKDSSLPIEKRIDDLLSRMTIEEKASQMDMLAAKDILISKNSFSEKSIVHYIDSMDIGSIHDFYPDNATLANELQRHAIEKSRLGIPILFIEEALHGYCGAGSTTFPIPLGNSCTWDTTLLHNIGHVIGTEARAHGIHFILGPNLDLAREIRWGRVEETFGEDIYLSSRMAVNLIKGIQGNNLKDNDAVAAEPKHFGVHGVPESGSNAASVSIGEREAREVLYIFEKAIKEAHAKGVMAAYHDIDGIPCVSNPWLLKTLLRNEWGFDGFVVSDLGAIARQQGDHRTAASNKDAIIASVSSGLDMQFYDYPHDTFQSIIVNAVKEGSLSENEVNRAVRGILRVKFELGLFDNPYTDTTLVSKVHHCEGHRKIALDASRESIVLLKNETNTLPLNKKLKHIALIGNLADISSIGDYSPAQAKGITIYEALKKRFGNDIKIDFIKTDVSGHFATVPASVLSTTTNRHKKKGLFVEYFNNSNLNGMPAYTTTSDNLSPYWHNLSPAPGINNDIFSVRWSGNLTVPISGLYEFRLSNNNSSRLNFNNNLLIDNWGKIKNGILTKQIYLKSGQSYPLTLEYSKQEGNASTKLEWRLVETSSNTTSSFFNNITQAASIADATIVVIGEYNEEVGEGKDRQNLNLSPIDIDMVKSAAKSGKKVITVVLNGRPLVLTPICNYTSALIEAWFPGEEGGNAILDVLFGDYNPSGKLSMSFPKAQGQLPIYYSRKSSSLRRYVDGDGEPLFCFGHGLSYSSFEYKNLKITPEHPTISDCVKVTLSVKNTSLIDGSETVQLYVQDRISSVSTPIAALKGFAKVNLKAGEEKNIEIDLTPEQFSFINREMKRVVEPGEFIISLGSSFKDIRLHTSIYLSNHEMDN
jgi:beta-glucosidase